MRRLPKRVWPLLALVVGAGLVALAQGEIRAGQSLGIYQAFSVNPLPSSQLDGNADLTARLEASASAAIWSSPYLDHACLNRLVAASGETPDREALKQTEACFARSLAASPLQACSWTSLAYTRHLLGEASTSIASPLSISYALGAREGRCMPLRLWTALRHWPALPPGLQDSAAQDVMSLMRGRELRGRLIDAYLDSAPEGQKTIEEIVARDKTIQSRFNSALKRRLRAAAPPA